MENDKIIDYEQNERSPDVHRLLGPMPDFSRRYGLWIINAGCAVRSPADGYAVCCRRRFEFYSLSHLIDGGGGCWIDGQGECGLHPGQLVVITPGTLNRYGGDGGKPYIEDSIRFTGPAADMLCRAGILRSGVFEFGPARRLLPLAELIQDPSRDALIKANITLQKLVVDLYLEQRKKTAASPVGELLEAVKADPEHWWTVEEMAEFCNLSIDRFRRAFRARTGMLPKTYVEEFKLRLAAERLISTGLPVSEIAERLGYRDPYHFSRRFKQFAGVSPEHYRREFPGSHETA